MAQPRVVFVSKPVQPPFRDGAVCLVRDMARFVSDVRPTVLATASAPPLADDVDVARVYARRGSYAPALQDNLRTLTHLLFERRYDLWHFVFAPNPKSSQVGALLKALRRRPIVQTVASRPKSFESVDSLLFGDHIIALSQHTADRLVGAGVDKPIHVLPPPCSDLSRDVQARRRARQNAQVPSDVPMLVYAGDLEFSSGARVMAEATPSILRDHGDVHVVFACRAKTPRAREVEQRLQAQLAGEQRVHWVGEVEDLPALLASATLLPFPVDNLYGKVDLPYVLLEAALLRVPSVVPRGGPLEEIPAAVLIDPDDPRQLAGHCSELLADPSAARQLGEQARQGVLARHDPAKLGASLDAIYRELLHDSVT